MPALPSAKARAIPSAKTLTRRDAASCRAKPSAFLFLGIKNETHGSVHGLHSSKFKLDQTALKTGAAMHAALASEWLAKQAAVRQGSSSDEL